ncbi:XRE family transcriptional regulator [Paraburkholderia gardini]|uniref:XRE family transcriptional regulator n=1 Tax=Paraburkholderia gardini TaxID=2823469 RepID=UPI001DCC6164|nr:XRE family transcriptional regulator [Paraburkholderia gardini]CAG4889247.1 hypothetical protein R69919_00694 [Paraburkholderia gardini]
MHYKPPTPDDLERLRTRLGKSSGGMAELFGVANGRQFRRYLSANENNKRDVSAYMLFFAMARLELSAEAIERILARMRQAGAKIDLSAEGGESEPSRG